MEEHNKVFQVGKVRICIGEKKWRHDTQTTTLSIMAFSIKIICTPTLSIITPSIKTHSMTTLNVNGT